MPLISLGIESILADFELNRLESFLDLMERQLEEAQMKWKKDLERQGEMIEDSDTRDEFYEFYSDDYSNLMEGFPQIFRNSFLVTIYAFVENHLGRLCTAQQKARNLSMSPSKIRGDALDRAKTYLTDVARVSFPSGSKEWAEIQRYGQLRNRIVHDGGNIRDDDKGLVTYARTKGLIKGRGFDKGSILVTKAFSEEALRTVRAFVNRLEKVLAK